MKNALKILSLVMILGALIFTSSCNDDDGPIIGGGDEDGGSYLVADGLYLASLSGSDTTIVNANILSSAMVEGEGFAPTPRDGHFAGYMYLTSGSYFFAEVKDQSIVTVEGGSSVYVDSVGTAAEAYTYVELEANGASFSINGDGVYHVVYDEMESESYVIKINSWGVIGGAVYKAVCISDGFNADIDLETADVSASGSTWSQSDIILRENVFKFRYNNSWTIGSYKSFTNLGGTLAALSPGGDNISNDSDGLYTITVSMDDSGVFSATAERTGDSEECAFAPENFAWGFLGSAVDGDDLDGSETPDGWENADQNLFYKGNIDGKETWLGVVTFEGTDGAFKLRTNDDWAYNLGGTLAADGTESTLVVGGDDIANPGAGMYFVTLTTADFGETWQATMVQNGWGIIGAATPTGWDSDTDLTPNGTVSGVATYSITIDLVVDAYKFRANDDWAYNIGGDLSALTPDGSDLAITEAGTYDIVLSYDGNTYSATVTKQ